MNLGNKIYELRRTKNLSQENLADILGVTRQTVSKWETNQSLPDLDKVLPLCKVFEISVEELLGNASESVSGGTAESIASDGIEIRSENSDSEDGTEKSNTGNFEGCEDDESIKEKFRMRSAIVVSGAVFAYIAAVAIMVAGVAAWGWNPVTTVAIFLIIVGGATAAIIWNFMSMPKFRKEQKEATKSEKLLIQINSIIWAATVALYFLVSFQTKAWYTIWVFFIIASLCCQIAKLVILLLDCDKNDGEKNAENEGGVK